MFKTLTLVLVLTILTCPFNIRQDPTVTPDIPSSLVVTELCVSTEEEELLTSFNIQDQSPDDPSDQDRQYSVPHLISSGFHQILSNVL